MKVALQKKIHDEKKKMQMKEAEQKKIDDEKEQMKMQEDQTYIDKPT